MTETHRINIQLKAAHQGGAWHGPSLRELLDGVTATQAAQHLLPDAHSIWELVNHIRAWEAIVNRRALGETISDVPDEINFPPVTDTGDSAWQAALQQLDETNRQLRATIQQLDEAQLQELAPGKTHPLYFELHGALQHTLYHAGQIALLKKALT
ncbi:MAG: DinB family protein [Acidobacteria bacterium]|nr:DinB family protein [Acidobacteriota bacterium]MBI3424601.1 DinB family protein [Acidobacteriota bacterium]